MRSCEIQENVQEDGNVVRTERKGLVLVRSHQCVRVKNTTACVRAAVGQGAPFSVVTRWE